MVTTQQMIGVGIGTALAVGLLKGIGGKNLMKIKARSYAVIGLAAIAATLGTFTLLPNGVTPAAMVAGCPQTMAGKSVSDVTVQLGRPPGQGILYPGQIRDTGAVSPYSNGNTIYVD